MDFLIMGIGTLVGSLLAASSVLAVRGMSRNSEENQLEEKQLKIKQPLDNEMERTFKKMNTLYYCQPCERFTRQHIMELEHLKTYLARGKEPEGLCCPQCKGVKVDRSDANKQFPLLDQHRHCYKLTEQDFFELMDTVEEYRERIREYEEMKFFEEYERKHLGNGRKMEVPSEFKPKHFVTNMLDKDVSLQGLGFDISKFFDTEEVKDSPKDEVDVTAKTHSLYGVSMKEATDSLEQYNNMRISYHVIAGKDYMREWNVGLQSHVYTDLKTKNTYLFTDDYLREHLNKPRGHYV